MFKKEAHEIINGVFNSNDPEEYCKPEKTFKEYLAKALSKAYQKGIEEERGKVLAWLGYWRDKMSSEAVSSLQDILGVPKKEERKS